MQPLGGDVSQARNDPESLTVIPGSHLVFRQKHSYKVGKEDVRYLDGRTILRSILKHTGQCQSKLLCRDITLRTSLPDPVGNTTGETQVPRCHERSRAHSRRRTVSAKGKREQPKQWSANVRTRATLYLFPVSWSCVVRPSSFALPSI